MKYKLKKSNIVIKANKNIDSIKEKKLRKTISVFAKMKV